MTGLGETLHFILMRGRIPVGPFVVAVSGTEECPPASETVDGADPTRCDQQQEWSASLPCHSPVSDTSPSRSTVSPSAKVRASTHRSATPANGCTNGCSRPYGVARCLPARRYGRRRRRLPTAVRSRDRLRDRGCREVRSPRMGTRTRSGRAGGVPTRLPHTGLRPHPSLGTTAGDLTPRDLISRAVTSADCLDRATRR
jgi:hypothetical protein